MHNFFLFKQKVLLKFAPVKQAINIRTWLLPCLLLLFVQVNARAVYTAGREHDSLRISLLTCAPGEEIYTLFGHTAIRCENLTRGTDVIFNYGIFDFDTPNFVLRFALGETDYLLGVSTFRHFAAEYEYYGRDIWQQTLDLRQEEKIRLMSALEENYRPENRVYRYNFFYDNCATRPRDRIEQAVDGYLRYEGDMDDRSEGITFRDMLHLYSEGHPWSRFAMDLCMGVKADEPITRREMMFVPFILQEDFSKAEVVDTAGHARPLVMAEGKVMSAAMAVADTSGDDGFTPLHAAILLLALTVGATVYGIRRNRSLWGVDLVLFAAVGVSGCVLAFMVLFSQHPAISPNYLLFLFHPLHLFCLPWMLRKVCRREFSWYMLVNALILTLFMMFWAVIPQKFPIAVLPLILCLLVRSLNSMMLGTGFCCKKS